MKSNPSPKWKRLTKAAGWTFLIVGLYLLTAASLGYFIVAPSLQGKLPQPATHSDTSKYNFSKPLDDTESTSDNVTVESVNRVTTVAAYDTEGGSFILLAAVALLVVSRKKPNVGAPEREESAD
ncbi:MAG TPA: hypothetical protein VNI20_14170 [Fimbriimonadaceae bacterium]|nr:hypothetical protein [Fimbriimonadaceae bacterium]